LEGFETNLLWEGTSNTKSLKKILYLLLFFILYLSFFLLKDTQDLIDIFFEVPVILKSIKERSESNKRKRDEQGKFQKADSIKASEIVPLPKDLADALVGEMLGDGHLRYTHKDKEGNPTGNVHFAMTLKLYDYTMYL
jgi:hypothetical protein